MMYKCCSPLIVFLALCASVAHGEPLSVAVPSTQEECHLDGVGDEPFWRSAPVLSDFSVVSPKTGIDAAFSAEARVIIGETAVYFLVTVDNAQKEVFAPLSGRDQHNGDRIDIQLDPFGTGRRGYVFSVNAAGVLSDARVVPQGYPDYAWDSLFDAATVITATGWAAEFAIPFQSLRFDPKGTMWLAHVWVDGWAHQQTITWAPIDRNQSNWLSQGGHLHGFGNQTPGRDVELLPTVTTSWAQAEGVSPPCDFGAGLGDFEICGAQLDYGLGLKWGVTPSLTFDAVFNPDFSQIEADPGILDLNARFSIRLDERRPFFLEGADIFDTDFEIFYSRTIQQPEAAMKLSGKAGAFRVGILTALDPGDDDDYNVTQVARIQADVGDDATVGFMLVDREHWAKGKHLVSNMVMGLDGQAYFMKRLNLEGELFMATLSETTENAANHRTVDMAGKARAVWKTDDYRVQASYRMVGEAFESRAGFIPRRGFHEAFAKLDGYYRSESPWARTVSPGVWARYNVGQGGEIEDRIFGMNTYWQFGNRVWSYFEFGHNGELVLLDESSEESTWMEASRLSWYWGSGTLQWLRVKTGMSAGQTPIRDSELYVKAGNSQPFLGWFYSPMAEFTLRPANFLSLRASYRHSMFLDGPSGLLLGSQPVVRGEVQGFLNRDMSVRHIVQWTDHNTRLINDFLFSYTPVPGTVVYAGYRQTDNLEGTEPVDRAVFFKGSILLDF